MAPKKPSSADPSNASDRRAALFASDEMEAIRRNAVGRVASTIECRRIVDQILIDVDEEIVRIHVDTMAVPWTVQSCITELFESIHFAFGEREAELNPQWDDPSYADVEEVLLEPLTIPADPWCRGVMSKRKPLQLNLPQGGGYSSNGMNSTAGGLSNGSMVRASRAASRSAAAGTGGGGGGAAASRGSVAPLLHAVLPGDPTATTDERSPTQHRPGSASSDMSRLSRGTNNNPMSLKLRPNHRPSSSHESNAGNDTQRSTARSTAAGGGAGKGGAAATEKHTVQQIGAMERTTGQRYTEEELLIIRQQKESAQRVHQLKKISERIDHQLAEVKSATPFIVDGTTHSVILVHTIDPATLPARQEPKVLVDKESAGKGKKSQQQQQSQQQSAGSPSPIPQVGPDVSAQQDDPSSASSLFGRRGANQSGSGAGAAGNKPRVDYSQFYQQEAQTQPMIGEFAPAAGVATKEGEVVRRTELSMPKMRMTKGEFGKLLQQQNSVAAQQAAAKEHAEAVETPLPSSPAPQAKKTPAGGAGIGGGSKQGSVAAAASSIPPPTTVGPSSLHMTKESIVMLDNAPQRTLTPQPTATRPAYLRSGSRAATPTAGTTEAQNSSSVSRPASVMAQARLQAQAMALAAEKHRSASRQRMERATAAEDETAQDFLSTLEMGDFEALPYSDVVTL